jgi:hypothetical protein
MMEEDHQFTLEVDIIRFDQDSDRVVINGYLGDKIKTDYTGDKLLLHGSEACISLNISQDEFNELIEKVTKPRPELL